MSITVVVPVHNNSSTLKRVIEPLKRELLPGDRILAVDDRSADNSRSLLGELEIEVVPSTGETGAAGTRNTGGFLAETGWILFVDADAVAPAGWREQLAERIADVQAVQAVYSRNAVGESAATFYKNYYYFHTFTRRIRGPYIKGCGTFFFAVKTDVFRELEGFDENIAGATIEDADFSERLWAKGGKIVIAPEIEIFHLREYTTAELFSYEWNMMRAKALYILRRDRSRGAPSISVAGFREMIPVLSGAVFSWIFIIGLLMWAAGSAQGMLIAAAGLAITAAGQASFKLHAIQDGGFRGLRACMFILPDLLLIVPATMAAVFTFLAGRRY
ncbi:MAG: glycosyltransferase [Candidatus Sabulitectum sp.]|nr:glycosyltransferase [Candidatus Sabulitectum sp.]